MTDKILHVHGDSQVATAWANCLASETMPHVLARALTGAGYPFAERNSGLGGSSSGGYGLAGIQRLFLYGKPDAVILAHGYNDQPNGISQAQTKLNLRCQILAAKFEAVGAARRFGDEDAIYADVDLTAGVNVANPAALPAGCRPGQRFVVVADDSTTGGRMASGQTVSASATGILDGRLHPTITATLAGSPPSVWECRHPIAGEYGWGRVAKSDTIPWGVKRIAVEGIGFLNIIGGDDIAVNDTTYPFGHITTGGYAGYELARQGQKDAADAEAVTVDGGPGVIFVNQYQFLRQRIVDGLDPDDHAGYTTARNWHRANGNQHYNAYGHQLRAQNLLAQFVTNWTTDGEWL